MSIIYVAAPYELRNEATQAMVTLEKHGHSITSRWLWETEENGPTPADKDLEDIRMADTLLVLHPEEFEYKGTGGRHFEMGYAVALGKNIVLVGRRTNNFHHLNCVTVVESVEAYCDGHAQS